MKDCLRRMMIWTVLIGVMVLPGAVHAGTIVGDITQVTTGPPTWEWFVQQDAGAGDPATPANGDELIFDMLGSGNWTTDITKTTWSMPQGWDLDAGRLDVIRFHVTAATGTYGTFLVTPFGPVSDTPSSNHPPHSGPSAPVPEASTMALLGLGLFAGALLKWRKKEE